ncbi:MAG: alpha/beta hydrolase [Clostridiales bacterium]|nr:alpha/beta hydrolase [Clostridiales bacterium]
MPYYTLLINLIMNTSKKHTVGVISLFTLVFLTLALFFSLCLTSIIYEAILGRRINSRTEQNAVSFYMFDSMTRLPVSFKTKGNVSLNGYIYSSKSTPCSKDTLIVFSHGIMCMESDYLFEIEMLTQSGYEVFAYDCTGTGISGGKKLMGLSYSTVDLEYALKYISQHSELSKREIILYGHSWGAFAAAAVLNNSHPEVRAVVCRSGFNEPLSMLMSQSVKYAGEGVKITQPLVSIYEWLKSGAYSQYTAVDGLNNSQIPALILQGTEDTLVTLDQSIAGQREHITNPRVQIEIIEGKGHGVLLADEAIQYKNEQEEIYNNLLSEYSGNIPQNELDEYYSEYDVYKSQKIDNDVADLIVGFINSALAN